MCIHKAFAWPEAEAEYRIGVEGLLEDFESVEKQPGISPTAANHIREDEPMTPARIIERSTLDLFQVLQSSLLERIDQLEDSIVSQKAKEPTSSSVLALIRNQLFGRVFEDTSKLRVAFSSLLLNSMVTGAEAGARVGALRLLPAVESANVTTEQMPDRLREVLSGVGSGRVGQYRMNDQSMGVLSDVVEQVANGLFDDTRSRLEQGIDAYGREATLNPADVRRYIQESYDLSPNRAATIARTETARAFHVGQTQTWEESGIVKRKQFLMAFDACQFCQRANLDFGIKSGNSVPINRPFYSKGSTIVGTMNGTMTIGLDAIGSIHPNCRCGITGVVEF